MRKSEKGQLGVSRRPIEGLGAYLMFSRLWFRSRLLIVGAVMAALAGSFSFAASGPAGAVSAGQRIDLKVLVISDGGPTVEGIAFELDQMGVPFTKVVLGAAGRPAITPAYLSSGTRAFFQAVVLPNEAPAGLSAAELTALANFETTFGIREVDSYTFPNPTIGLNYPGYSGAMDGRSVTATAVAKTGPGTPFASLAGPVTFDDVDPAVSESWGYVAEPLAATATSSFTTLVEGAMTSGGQGSLIGVFKQGARERMIIGAGMNAFQSHFQFLVRGVISWMTQGVHLGYDRNYFTMHIDDVFAPDARWSVEGKCTPGDDCPAGITTTDIRMVPADVDALVAWQNANGIKLDMVFNGKPSVDIGADPLLDKFKTVKTQFPWINHTYDHLFLGCIQNFAVIPWACATSGSSVQWMPAATIRSEISLNKTFANTHGLPIRANELVTGEHSGLKVLPQQTVDNPNLASALKQQGITVVASDSSREPVARQVGSATAVPRYPMSVYYNTGRFAEMVSEYNWVYTSTANGGSGICAINPLSTCIAPLDLATGYQSYIVPLEARIDLMHILTNDVRPHYAHQSNLTEDRILYPVLDEILRRYRASAAANMPLVQPTFTEARNIMTRANAWKALPANRVTAYYLNGKVVISSSGLSTNMVPITMPNGTKVGGLFGGAFGEAYAGERSAWVSVSWFNPLTLVLP